MRPIYRPIGLLLLILLTACGQKGDLVLPERGNQAHAPGNLNSVSPTPSLNPV